MNTTIPYYDIANKFLLGFLFLCGTFMLNFNFILGYINSNDKLLHIPTGLETILTICFVALVYEVGVITSRISSVFMECFFIFIKVFPKHSNYGNFNDAEKANPKLSILSNEYVFCRGHATLFLFLTILATIMCNLSILILFSFFMIIFLIAGRKQSKRINELVAKHEDEKPKHRDMIV